MNTKSKLKAISIGIAAIMMVSLLAAVTTVSASDVTYCWIGEDDNKVYFTIYSDAKAEGERKKYGLNAGETATLSFREYRWNGVDDVEVCADCVDSCCTPDGSTKPDLIVSEKWEESVNEGVIVYFKVTNIGEGDAKSSTTASLEINGIYEGTVGVPALVAGDSYVGAFAPEPCPPLTTITVTVCADNDDVVDESDETNNCKTNEFTCPAPDLVVSDKYETFDEDGKVIVHFEIHNDGDADAGASYATKYLYIDDELVEKHNAPVPVLGPSGRFNGAFEPEDCPPGVDITVKVCADDTHVVDESNEDNNCMINYFTCPVPEKPDLVVEDKWEDSEDGQMTVHFVIENIGGAEAGESEASLYINRVLVHEQNVAVPVLGPGGTFSGAFAPADCPPGTTITVTVCADDTHVVDESKEDNNCRINEFTCPGKPDLVVIKKWEEHEYICCGLWNVIVHFVVENIGGGDAGPSIACKKIDGVLMDTDDVPALAAGKSYASAFDPEPCPPGTTINFTVCADNFDDVDESNETNNCMTNNCTCTTEKPDLVVINKWEEAVRSDGHVIVHFIVKNNGTADAGESEAALYIDRVRVQEQNVPVSALGPNGTFSGEFATELCPLADNITVKVCADDTHVVDESNETNNCMTNYFTCPSQGPDLVIAKTVDQRIVDCNTCEYQVNYTVTNIGNEVASWCCGNNTVALLVDGVELGVDNDIPELGPGASWDGGFVSKYCNCANDFNVTVCADYYNVIDEGNESNNCKINLLHCGIGRITVVKKVRFAVNPACWADDITGAEYCDIVVFNGTVNNTGCCCNLTNIAVIDVLSSSLEYVNATPTPSTITNNTDGTTTLTWPIIPLLEPCDVEEYLITAHVIGCGIDGWDRNDMTASATTCTGGVVSHNDTAWVEAPSKAAMNVTKTVWNGTAWVDTIEVHNGTELQFNCTVHNNGTCYDLKYITVLDTLSESLEYNWSTGPGGQQPQEYGGLDNSTVLEWDIDVPSVLMPCEKLYFLINATVKDVAPDVDINTVDVTAWSELRGTSNGVWLDEADVVEVTVAIIP
jgi:subtilase family serine protease